VSQVHLSGNGIGDRGAIALCEALGHDALVTDLDLSNNNIGLDGALAVQKLLQHNGSLANVNLSGNKKLTGSSALAPLFQRRIQFPQSFDLSRDLKESFAVRLILIFLSDFKASTKIKKQKPHTK